MSDSRAVNSKQSESPSKRRGLLIGAGVAGVGVIAAKALSGSAPEATALAAAAPKIAESSGGYRLTEHVLRYYETTRA